VIDGGINLAEKYRKLEESFFLPFLDRTNKGILLSLQKKLETQNYRK
jgi:hypothetical protein